MKHEWRMHGAKQNRRRIFFISLIVFVVAAGVRYASEILPLISGYGAKVLCSSVFVGGQPEAAVIANELGRMPIALGRFRISRTDSSAIGSTFGLATRKAIYRQGRGCTLLGNDAHEALIITAPESGARIRPRVDLPEDFASKDVDHARITGALDDAFSEPSPKRQRRTRAVVVLHRGRIVAERYADGFSPTSRFPGWSMAKSVTNALIGVLVKKGRMSLDDRSLFPEWKSDARDAITVRNLLHATAGLDWREEYAGASDATKMLLGDGDVARYARSVPLVDAPGKRFVYSSGATNLLSALASRAMGADYAEFPDRELFDPLGMTSAVFERDVSGTFVGSSYLYATARDWARFGLLYLNDGRVGDRTILPPGWVEFSTQPGPGSSRREYGAHFWLNADPEDGQPRRYPALPADAYFAHGYEGQGVWVIPSRRLVVVRLSLEHGDALDENRFLAEIFESVRDQGPAQVIRASR